MHTITFDELDAGMERLAKMDMAEMEDVYALLQKEQPFLQDYIAWRCAGELLEHSEDAGFFISPAMAVWHIMRSAAGRPLAAVDEADIKQQEDNFLELYSSIAHANTARSPPPVEDMVADCNQKPLLAFVLNSLMEPEADEDAGAEWNGLLFSLFYYRMPW